MVISALVSLDLAKLFQLSQGEVVDEEVAREVVVVWVRERPVSASRLILVSVKLDIGDFFEHGIVTAYKVSILGQLQVQLDKVRTLIMRSRVRRNRMLRIHTCRASMSQHQRSTVILEVRRVRDKRISSRRQNSK